MTVTATAAEQGNAPWMLNQPGLEYPAELVRAQHFDATSGGNGVSSPDALRVTAQPAPDGTVQIGVGGATLRSNYVGQDGQSYHAHNFQPQTLVVPPTGSSSAGRHDLLIMRVIDPDHDDTLGSDIGAEEAFGMDFWRFELHQGRDRRTQFDFPHVKLAHIRRGPNQTIVRPEDIHDLRQLANPKTWLHMRAANLYQSEEQHLYSGTDVWPRAATHTMPVPEFATRMQILATWGTVRSSGTATGDSNGVVQVRFTPPSGSSFTTQISRWTSFSGETNDRFNIVLGENLSVPSRAKGEDVTVELLGRKSGGPNIFMDGTSSWSLQVYFEQEIR